MPGTLRRNILYFVLALAWLSALALFACAPRPGFRPMVSMETSRVVERLDPSRQKLDSWRDLRPGLERSLAYVSTRDQDAPALDRDDISPTWADLRLTLERLLEILPRLDADPGLLSREFVWHRLGPDPLMTGYYAPWLEASPVRTEVYRYPLYAVPDDLKTVKLGGFHPRWEGQSMVYRLEDGRTVPYHDRRAIDYGGALAGRGLELAWLKDPVDAFFLHIQGSGLLHYPDGSTRHVLYAGKNGRQYVSLGRVLADRGLLPLKGMSMQAIRGFLAENPQLVEELLSTNPSYVFFRLDDQGPYGAMGRLLTPLVSVATDPNLLPLGSVIIFEADLPSAAPGGKGRKVAALALAHDKGGAIKQRRIDYFCGSGPEVEFIAGRIKTHAALYILLHKEVTK